jgi:hypothetical protein
MDYEPGELGEDLDPEGEIEAFAYGDRPGQYIEVEQLEEAMADEINWGEAARGPGHQAGG